MPVEVCGHRRDRLVEQDLDVRVGRAARTWNQRQPGTGDGKSQKVAALHTSRDILRQSEILHDVFVQEPFEGLWMRGLGEEVIESCFACALPIFFLPPSGQRDEPHRVPVTHSDLACDFVAIHVGKADVEQEHAWGVLLSRIQRGAATVRNVRVMPHQAEQHSQHLGRIHIIVHDKHAQHVATIIPRRDNRGSPSERTTSRARQPWTAHSTQPRPVVGCRQILALNNSCERHSLSEHRRLRCRRSVTCFSAAQPEFLRSDQRFFLHEARNLFKKGNGPTDGSSCTEFPCRSKFPADQS